MKRPFLPLFLVFSFLLASGGFAQDANQVKATLDRVKNLLKAKQAKEAISVLEGALQKAPQAHQLWIALGYAHEEAKDLPRALEAFRKARDLKQGLAGVAAKIVSLEKRLGAETAPGTGSPSTVLADDRMKARRLFDEAVEEKSLGRFETAFPKFVEVVDLDSSYLSDDQGMIPAALNFYREMAKKDPEAVYFLGVYQHLYGELDDALRLLRRFVDSNPASPLLEKAGKRIKAIEEARKKLADAAKAAQEQARAAAAPPPKKPPVVVKPLEPRPASGTIPAAGSTETASGTSPTEPSLAEQMAAAGVADMVAQAEEMRAQKRPVAAINLYTVAAAKQDDPQIWLNIGDLYLEDNAQNGARAAILAYQKVIERFPRSAQATQARKKIQALNPSTEQRAQEVADHFAREGTSHLNE